LASFRTDGVFLPPDPSGIVYFCEVQFQPDPVLYERINSEIGIYVYRNRERFSDWQAVLIYPSRKLEQSNTSTVRELLVSGRITRIYLDELGTISELPLELGLMVLTTLEGDEAKIEARSAIERSGGDRVIIELVSTIIVYKFSELSREEVDAMLGIELQQTRVYQEARTEEAISLVLRQLNRKFGELSPQLRSRVSVLQIDQVESLGEELLDFTSISDLESWFSQN
jgi:predicted transposase/invertase (TIGR01784 family)